MSRLTIEEFYWSNSKSKLFDSNFFNYGENSFILGLGVFSHDTSAALVSESTREVIFAQSEERNSNIKHDSGFPIQAILNSIPFLQENEGFISKIALNFNPWIYVSKGIVPALKSASCSEIFLEHGSEFQDLTFTKEILSVKVPMEVLLKRISNIEDSEQKLNTLRKCEWYLLNFRKYQMLKDIIVQIFTDIPVIAVDHHLSHASSVRFGFKKELLTTTLVLDGHGEVETSSIYDDQLKLKSSTNWPISLGSFYLSGTRYLGFDYGDEYKVMGMAASGVPRFGKYLSNMFEIDTNTGKIKVQDNDLYIKEYVGRTGQVRYNFSDNFGRILPKRNPNQDFKQEHFDFAASIQEITEKIGLDFAKFAKKCTGADELLISGGVGLNGLMNQKIREAKIFKEVHIFPASGDDGTSVGAAQSLIEISKVKSSFIKHVFFGPRRDESKLESVITEYQLDYFESDNISEQIASLIYSDKVVARYVGRSEFGPRALGNRSILANPLNPNIKKILNEKIKHREQFRPFAPSILEEYVSEYFEFNGNSPFMLFIPKAKSFLRSSCPGIVHLDGTSRIQTVNAIYNPDFYALISEFFKLSGVPIVVNTSFNLNGETIVETYKDAIESFLFMDIDVLAIENFIVKKNEKSVHFKSRFFSHDMFISLRKNRYFNNSNSALKSIDCRKYGIWYQNF